MRGLRLLAGAGAEIEGEVEEGAEAEIEAKNSRTQYAPTRGSIFAAAGQRPGVFRRRPPDTRGAGPRV